jgi:chondroitin-sulfate-ABC endolyase/exolyase
VYDILQQVIPNIQSGRKMQKISAKAFIISILLMLTVTNSLASPTKNPAVESFESNSVLNYYQHSESSDISISTKHYKFGQHSLKWQWQGKSTLTTQHFRLLTRNQSPLKYGKHFPASPTLVISLYSENSQSTSLKISFDKQDHKGEMKTAWFDLPLNFSGWRTIWLPFYEMNGDSPKKNASINYDTFTISSSGNGHVFIDDIVFSQFQDDRHPYPSAQTPFIQQQKQETASDHWMPLLSDLQRVKDLQTAPLKSDDIAQLTAIEEKISTLLKTKKQSEISSPESFASLKHDYAQLGLTDNGKTVQGPPLTYALSQFYFDEEQQGEKRHTPLKDFGIFLKKLAQHYVSGSQENKIEVEKMFIQASRYYLDQGWQSGTSMGTLHHIGYSTRKLTEAFYLMRNPLQKAGILNEIGASLQWIFNLGKLLGDKDNFHANIDYMNTQSFYHLLLIFLSDDRAMQASLLQHFSDYISIILAQDDGYGVFKVDGTAWHHGGHYPAYALGAFEKIPQLIYTLSDSRFKISQAGHANFKKAFLASRIYSQPFDFGFGNAGRHPFDGSFSGLQQQYLQLALAGDPQHNNAIDKEVAAAYLRLWDNEGEHSTLFKQHNISAENLTGYYSFPYAATSVHRNKGWAALIKGYSKYVWASEIYVASNRYGRYPANGTVQLLNEQGEKGSGFNQNGWDWNRFPGATVINLPIEQLETTKPLLMFRSNESFAGSVHLNNNGLFAMQLNESQGFNHEGNEKNQQILTGELKAKKSVFSFNDKLIFIGTDISSRDNKNPVQTNLFQTYLTAQDQPQATSMSGLITEFPYQTTLQLKHSNNNQAVNSDQHLPNNWLIDPYGNGYHLLSESKVTISRKHQNSLHNKYSLYSGKMNAKGKGVSTTEGSFASAWIDHGLPPKNSAYQYVVYPFISKTMDKKEVNSFDKITLMKQTFKVLQANNQVHIVTDHITKTTGYAIFTTEEPIQHGLLSSTSVPALIMIQQLEEKKATLSVVQPDLNFPQLKPIKGYSQPVPLTITLKGKWQVTDHKQIASVAYVKGNTEINLICQHGLPVMFNVEEI